MIIALQLRYNNMQSQKIVELLKMMTENSNILIEGPRLRVEHVSLSEDIPSLKMLRFFWI